MTTATATATGLSQYDIERIDSAKKQILAGAKFNGTVYGTRKKNYTKLVIYIDGNSVFIAECLNSNAENVKQQVLEMLLTAAQEADNTEKQSWLVNGKRVYANATYQDMFNRYGMELE